VIGEARPRPETAADSCEQSRLRGTRKAASRMSWQRAGGSRPSGLIRCGPRAGFESPDGGARTVCGSRAPAAEHPGLRAAPVATGSSRATRTLGTTTVFLATRPQESVGPMDAGRAEWPVGRGTRVAGESRLSGEQVAYLASSPMPTSSGDVRTDGRSWRLGRQTNREAGAQASASPAD